MAFESWKRALSILASVGVIGGAIVGCGGPQNANNGTGKARTAQNGGTPKPGGNIVLDSIANFKDLDPAMGYDVASFELINSMYDTLVTYQRDTNNIVGRLAKSYNVSADGKTYTFHIRQGAKFWNGDPVTAQSFVDAFQRVLDKQPGSPGASFIDPIVVGSTAYHKGQASTISGITTPDKYTLQIKLIQPQAFFIQIVAMPFFSAIDKSWVTRVGNKAFDTTKPMGSGPFKLQTYTPTQAVLVKNPDYWQTDNGGRRIPYLDKVTINVNPNEQLEGENFESGKTALLGNMAQIPSSQYTHFLTSPSLKKDILSKPQNSVFYIGLNNKMAPFNNKLVRQAINYAIDKSKLQKLMNGRVYIANQPLPPGVNGYVKDVPADAIYTYDPNKAKALLKQAGFPNGFTTSLYVYNNPTRIKLCTSIQNDLAKIGIKASLRTSTWDTWLAQNEAGNVQPMFFASWLQDFPDASDFLNTLLNTNEAPANNSTNYSNKQVDAWLNAAQTEPNQAKRLALYKKATVQVLKDAPWAPLYWGTFSYAVQPWVHNYYISPTLPDPLQYMWIDPDHSQG